MEPGEPLICFACSDADVRAAHDLFLHRIGPGHVEHWPGFRSSARRETPDWIPRLALAYLPGCGPAVGPGQRPGPTTTPRTRNGRAGAGAGGARRWQLAGAQLGGLLPPVGLVSLPYSAVTEPCEGRGVYLALKRAMLAELRALAFARGLAAPAGNVAEEAPGSAQYARKVGGGFAVPLPIAYLQPAVQGLKEAPLALTYEPLAGSPPPFSPDDTLRIVAAVYRGLYRIARPDQHPAFRKMAASLRDRP